MRGALPDPAFPAALAGRLVSDPANTVLKMTTNGMPTFNENGNPVVYMHDGEPMADSRDVATYFGKQHKNIIQAFRELHCSDDFRRLNFQPIKINDLTGEATSHIMMTKDGFSFLVLGFTGAKAGHFKERYIAAFNAMEAELRARPAFDPSKVLNDPVAMRGLLLSYTEKVLELEAKVAEQTEDVAALDRIAKSDGSLCITDAAKALQVRPKDLFDYLKAHNWIYRRTGSDHWVGYQTRVNGGDLEHKVTTVLRADGSDKTTEQVRVTPQGLAKLAKLMSPAVRAA